MEHPRYTDQLYNEVTVYLVNWPRGVGGVGF